MEEDDHQRRATRVKPLGDVKQNARVVEGLVLPVDLAVGRAMSTSARISDIEKWLALARHLAAVGGGARFELDQPSAWVGCVTTQDEAQARAVRPPWRADCACLRAPPRSRRRRRNAA